MYVGVIQSIFLLSILNGTSSTYLDIWVALANLWWNISTNLLEVEPFVI